MAMNAGDMESLASMLDKNRTFERPQGQTTGFSLQEHPAAAPANAVVATSMAAGDGPANPSGVALPPTVVDHQLRLPAPSHGKAAEKRLQQIAPAAPRGDEIWTQTELQERYAQQRRAGPAPLAAAARAAAAAASPSSSHLQAQGGALWRPPADAAGSYEEPVHTVLYQQNLSAEDVYLGVDFTRDASSAASDGVTVRVELPKVTAVSEIATEVDPYELRVSVAGLYYLAAALPRRVQRASAEAAWDGQKKLLTVRLRADQSTSDVKIVS